jgi:hypothetical protein
MDIDITSTGPDKMINTNDKLGGIQIYDYTNLNMTGAVYTVSVTQMDADGKATTKSVGTTTFRKADDRLIWIPLIGAKIDELRDVTKI